MNLNFYTRPFRLCDYSGWVYDAKDNFVFQFETKYNRNGTSTVEGGRQILDKPRQQQVDVIFSLNSLDPDPMKCLSLATPSVDVIQIYNDGEPFITIRGWGNLTGIGGYNFSNEKAMKIQDDFKVWLMYRLTGNEG